jgi:hypothetical protein
MRNVFIFFLWVFLLIFVVASLYISFTDYLYTRDMKILSNVTAFLTGIGEENKKVHIPYPEETVIMLSRKPAGMFVSANVGSPIDREKYTQMTLRVKEGVIYMYVRKVDIIGYLLFISDKPLYIGLLTASFLLYLSIFYFTLKEFQLTKKETLTEELLARIKALRLTLATLKLIPEESVDEMKRIVDAILGHRITKK